MGGLHSTGQALVHPLVKGDVASFFRRKEAEGDGGGAKEFCLQRGRDKRRRKGVVFSIPERVLMTEIWEETLSIEWGGERGQRRERVALKERRIRSAGEDRNPSVENVSLFLRRKSGRSDGERKFSSDRKGGGAAATIAGASLSDEDGGNFARRQVGEGLGLSKKFEAKT